MPNLEDKQKETIMCLIMLELEKSILLTTDEIKNRVKYENIKPLIEDLEKRGFIEKTDQMLLDGSIHSFYGLTEV